MSSFVGLGSLKLADRRVLITAPLSEGWHKTVISDRSNVDPGGPRPTLLRPGMVLLYGAASGRYFDDAAQGDPSAPAIVAALASADATWAGKAVDVYKNGGLVVSVPLGPNDNTDAAVAAELNNNAAFRASFLASVVNARVTVAALEPGAHVATKIQIAALPAAFGPAGAEARGRDGDYVVTVGYVNQLNPLGSPSDVQAHVVGRGHFDEANLVGLTQDAKGVLLRRGSRFGR